MFYCPIAAADPNKIAVVTSKSALSYRELNEQIEACSILIGEVLPDKGSIETLVRLFALLRQGHPIHFNRPLLALSPEKRTTIAADTLLYLRTSGTTGAPKEVAWPFKAWKENIENQLESYPSFKGASHRAKLGWSRMGGLSALMRPLFSEGTAVLDETSLVDFESCVPTQLIRLLEKTTLLLSKNILIGGAKYPDSVIKSVQERGSIPVPIYSTTELGTCMIEGKPVKGVNVLLQENGTLAVQKKSISKGLLIDKNGYYQTQDIAIITASGWKIIGRGDRVINTGGEKVLLHYIEDTVQKIENDLVPFAFATPDPIWGEALCLAYARKAPLSHEELLIKLKEQLPRYMIPKKIIHLPPDAPAKPPLSYLQQLAD
ncbi:MAG: hypothetical protein ACOYK9_04125 [Chlamydiia bacterium]